jgi:2,4-dienoyl-CoA reductase-like NADH-dependent reductase (Old Yellow Enzyme family)/thioredoxin reductase
VQSLFKPIKIGNLQLSNRIILSPMVTGYANAKGEITDRQISYYRERAKGGVGLIITESNYVSIEGRGNIQRLGLHRDDLIVGHKKLTEETHKYSVPICAQLAHNGTICSPKGNCLYPVSSCSRNYFETGDPYIGLVPRKLKISEIQDIVKAYGQAARRAREAGFDAVQLHGAHGYLTFQFLSPRLNNRSDEYGGTKEGRAKFLLDILREVRKQVGPEFPILSRLNAEDNLPGGYTMEFTKWLAKELVNNGVNEINLTMGTYEELDLLVKTGVFPQGGLADLTQVLKKEISIPVSVVGRIKNPEVADKIVADGKADLVYLGRALIADPEWPKKAMNGSAESIRPCISCNRGCFQRLMDGLDINCTVNPLVGREGDIRLKSTTHAKRVLIVGAGPAGLEAARVAAGVGHEVLLYEKTNQLGGQLNAAGKLPYKDEEIPALIKWLSRQAKEAGAKIRLNHEIDSEGIERLKPDAVIIATGSDPMILDIPGSEMPHVISADDVLTTPKNIGEKVFIIGGGLVGTETAEFLVDQGRDVTIVEMREKILYDAEVVPKKALLERISEKGVKVIVGTEVLEINNAGLVVRFLGERREFEADTIVLAAGRRSCKNLKRKIDTKRYTLLEIGDTIRPRNIQSAIQEGFDCIVQMEKTENI